MKNDKVLKRWRLKPSDSKDFNLHLCRKAIIAENREENGYLISLKPEDTQKLEFKDYRYDIGLQTNDGNYYMLVLCSPFVVNKAVTAKEWFFW